LGRPYVNLVGPGRALTVRHDSNNRAFANFSSFFSRGGLPSPRPENRGSARQSLLNVTRDLVTIIWGQHAFSWHEIESSWNRVSIRQQPLAAHRLIDISQYDFPAIFEVTDRDGG
jgi:hypothetical protein